MSPWLLLPAAGCLVALSAIRARFDRRLGREVACLDLPLGLSVRFELPSPPSDAREGLRSRLSLAGYRISEAGGRLGFRLDDRPSPWFGSLRSPRVHVGSLETSPASAATAVHVTFSTVPTAGWALVGHLLLAAGLGLAWRIGARGPWFWATAAALALSLRAGYQALARAQAVSLLGQLRPSSGR